MTLKGGFATIPGGKYEERNNCWFGCIGTDFLQHAPKKITCYETFICILFWSCVNAVTTVIHAFLLPVDAYKVRPTIFPIRGMMDSAVAF